MVETREHALANLAMQSCLDKVEFGDVLILTDRPLEFSSLTGYCNPRIHIVPDWPDKLGWSRAWWYDVPPLLATSHTLNIQWDSWVWDTTMWSPEFLQYDYIGAPWWYKDGKNVGNGGFSLVSTRLKRYMRANRWKFSCDTNVDDDLLCRKYRPALENFGFTWAPEHVAHEFAFECCRPSPTSRHFGFHAAFNFNEVLSSVDLEERARLMLASPYISKTEYIMKAFCQKNPELMRRLVEEQLEKAKGA
jgi:hypothetical protein